MLQHVVRAASAEYLKRNSISTGIDWSWVIVFQLAGRAHLLLMEAVLQIGVVEFAISTFVSQLTQAQKKKSVTAL